MADREYAHGGDCYRNQVEYDFSININPLGMPEESRRAAVRGIFLSDRYPDERGEELCAALAEMESVRREQIVLGNGAAELIYGLCSALKPKKCLLPVPSFFEYESGVLSAGGKIVYFERKEEEDFELTEEIFDAVTKDTELLFVCNPNNPTGNLISKAFLEELAVRCEKTGTWLCLDECFLPFLPQEEALTMKHELERFPHLIILRAFTKVYGMPGLRLGYALSGSREFLCRLRRVLPPWNTSLPAQMAGVAALKDRTYLTEARKLIEKEREFLQSELSKGLADKIYPSSTNYLLFKAEEDLKERLLARKILIRDCSNFKGLSKGFFRIAVKDHEANCELLKRWKEYKGI